MLKRIVCTCDDVSALIARLVLGGVFFPHGAQKMLGWYGGKGFDATMTGFTEHMQIPYAFALLAVIAEFFGAIGLIVGFLGRIAAFGIFCVMAVAVIMVHSKVGFFMDWGHSQGGEGFEYHILAMGLAAVIMIRGSGALSIDKILSKKGNGSGKCMFRG